MCTPSTVEMYRVVNIDDPETFPGTFNHDAIDVVVDKDQTSKDPEQKFLQHESGSSDQEENAAEGGAKGQLSFCRQALAALAANMVHLSAGFAAGFSAPTMSAIQEEFGMSNTTKNWFASILVVGQVLGCILGGMASDYWGRRRVLIVVFSMSLIGWSTVAVSTWHPDKSIAVTFIFVGRFFHGLADSLGVSPAITFVSEITTVKMRGMFMNSATVAASTGIPLAYLIGSFYPWHLTAVIGAIFPLLGLLVLLAFIPFESPAYLWSKGRERLSYSALAWFRAGHPAIDISNEFKSYESSKSSAQESGQENTLQMFVKEETWKPFIIVMTLLGLVPLTGIMSVTFFAMELFQSLGFADSTVAVAVAAGMLRALGSAMAGVVVVFKGRRFVLLFSCFGAIVSIEIATLAMMLKENAGTNQDTFIYDYILIVSIPTYMFFLGVGMTPVPWILMGEWFVPETRSKAGGIASAMFFLSALLSLQMTVFLEKTIGVRGMFTSFGFVCILFAVIAYKWVPETQGKTYKDSILLKKASVWPSSSIQDVKAVMTVVENPTNV